MELQARNDEITMLRRKIATEVRERDLLRTQFPAAKKVGDEVTELQIQVCYIRQIQYQLDKHIIVQLTNKLTCTSTI